MLRLHHSNRMEGLASALVAVMRADPGDPFDAERIVVPHHTIGRWLSLEIASAIGIAANLEIELPAAFAWSIIRGALPDLPGEQAFSPAKLRWRIHDVLPRFVEETGEEREGDGAPGARAVRSYLEDGDPRKRFELADRLARVFDRYIVYRPEWIREWEGASASPWQARLWRRVMAAADDEPTVHWVRAIDAFRGAIAHRDRPADWPRRASFFAVSSLSPSYLELLSGIGQAIDLHLFVLNPCREYWGDIYSRGEIHRRVKGADPDSHYLTEGNELLAAWGRAGRDTIDSLVEIASGDFEDHFDPPPAEVHRLAAVQRDVLELRLAGDAAQGSSPVGDPGGRGAGEPAPVAGHGESGGRDDSIQVHACHSPVREAEVLHDRLLGLFDAHPGLEPADVLVLTPDLATYGPVIEAVFGAAELIPFQVARIRSVGSSAVRAFLDLLALPRSRYGSETVLVPLECPAVRTRFGIEEADLSSIRGWVREAGIRWGVDGAHRAEESLPASEDHTWRWGLKRLVLGCAMSDSGELFAGLVPCPPQGVGGFEPGADEAGRLGRFVTYCERVFELRSRLADERPPREWARVLRAEIDRFFPGGEAAKSGPGRRPSKASGDAEDGVDEVRRLVGEFEREAERAESRIGFEVVHDVLRERANEPPRQAARLADGVTVASLAPGQVFPAGVVCVVGLNDGVFPRAPAFPSFDRIAAGPARRGDRDVRHEDRFAFLEALLAARTAFLVSYTGRGQRDDAPIPPSAVVDELKDYLERRFPCASFETRHPLQPFSPRYFSRAGKAGEGTSGSENAGGDADLYSYSAGMCEAARLVVSGGAGRATPARFGTDLQAKPEAPRREVAFSDLVGFFANPARWFLRNRLGIRLELDDVSLDAAEPFALGPLEGYQLRAAALDRIREGVARERDEGVRRGSGKLPQAALGRIEHERVWKEAGGLCGLLARYEDALGAPPIGIALEVAGCRVHGEIANVGSEGQGLVWWRPAQLRGRDRIEVWLRQLVLAAAGHPVPAVALAFDRNRRPKETRFGPPDEARKHLSHWLEAWRAGQLSPLAFFPETSLAYAEAVRDDAGPAAARSKALEAWSGSSAPWSRGGEMTRDPYLRLVYDDRDPLTEGFPELATRLLGPLVEAVR